MARNSLWLALVSSALFFTACGPGSNVPGLDLYLEAADGKDHGQLTSLAVSPGELMLAVPDTRQVKVLARFADGAEVDATAHASLESSAPAVLKVGPREGGAFVLTARASGDVVLTARLGSLEHAHPQLVRPAPLVALMVEGPDRLERRSTAQLIARGTFADGRSEDLTTRVHWRSSNPEVLELAEGGLLAARGVGEAEALAELDGISSSKTVGVDCTYPEARRSVVAGSVIPALAWEGAMLTDGQGEEAINFSVEDVYCGRQFADRRTILFLVGAGWCTACPSYIRFIHDQIDELTAAGTLVVYVDAEDRNGNPATTAFTHRHINSLVGKSPSVRAGDAETKPSAGLIANSPIVSGFPTVFLVRTRDMKIYADQNASNYVLPLLDIAQHPEWDWSDPLSPVPTEAEPSCGEAEEEPGEPNNTIPNALAITEPGTYRGGICASPAVDFYLLELTGNWRATLRFPEEKGDLDLFVWDRRRDEPVFDGDRPVGSFQTVGGEEVVEWSGNSVLRIEGRFGETAPYELIVEPR